MARAPLTVKAGSGGACCWRYRADRRHQRRRRQARGRRRDSREKLAAPLGNAAGRRPAAARRQRGFPPGGCAFLHSPSGARHPLPDRRRHPHRHARPLDRLRPGRRLVRDRARTPCSRRRPPTGRAALSASWCCRARSLGKSSIQLRQRGGQGEAAVAGVQDVRRRPDRLPPHRLASGRTRGHAMATPYETDLDRNPANFQPLTPLSFLQRAASVFPDRVAIVHGPLRRSYATSMPARAVLPRHCASAASGAATPCRSCSPTRRPCWNAITACRWPAPCSTPSTRGSMRR